MKKATLVVLGIFALLLTVVLATREDRVSVGVRKLELPPVDKDQATAVELGGALKVRLEKEGGGWRVVDPGQPGKKYEADGAQVVRALEALGQLRNLDFVTDRPETHAEYALDEAQGLTLKVVQAGAPEAVLVLGKAAKNGGVYVRKAGTPEVFVARGGLEAAVRKDVEAWRQHTMLSLKPGDISQLVLRSKEGEVLTLNAGGRPGRWSVAEGTVLPPDFRLDAEVADVVARQLSALSAEAFLEGEAAADSATGLGGAHDIIEAKLKDGTSATLHLGPPGQEGEAVAARVEGHPQVFQIPAYSAVALRKRLEELRDLSLFRFDPAKVTKLKLQSGTTVVQAARHGEQWQVIEPRTLPEGFAFDSNQVEAILGWVGSLRAARLLDGARTDAQLGVGAPTALIEVSLEGVRPQVLRLGKDGPAGADGQKEVFARTTLDPLAYTVPGHVKARLGQGLQLFKKPDWAPGRQGPAQGLDQLPPEVRRQIEEQLRAKQMQ
jgi:hypothetical protein